MPISVCVYICSAPGVLHVYLQYGSVLRMCVVKTFEHREKLADNHLGLFVHRNVLLLWIYDAHA